MPKKHARYSPSKLDSLHKCVRFEYLQLDEGAAASEGTLLHEAFETERFDGLNDEQIQAVLYVLTYLDEIKETEGGPGQWIELKERKVTLKDLTYGSLDRALVHRKKPIIHVIDAKFIRVPSDYQFQLTTYAAALYEKLMKTKRFSGDVTITTHVVAPRLNEKFVDTYDGKTLYNEVREKINILYAKINSPFTMPTPHDEICGKCARAGTCPALANVAITAAKKITGLPLPSAFAPEAIVTPVDRGVAQALAAVLTNWADQIKKQNTEYVNADPLNNFVPGYKLTTRSTGLRLPEGTIEEALESLEANGITKEMAISVCNLPLGKLTDLVAECNMVSKGEAAAKVRAALDGIAVEGQTSYLSKEKRSESEESIITKLLT